jgi:hypothetical protein
LRKTEREVYSATLAAIAKIALAPGIRYDLNKVNFLGNLVFPAKKG